MQGTIEPASRAMVSVDVRLALALVLMLGWATGLVCGLAAVGNSYEYRLLSTGKLDGPTVVRMVEQEGWEPVALHDGTYLRRPRLRLP